jgi:hypothetical protein
VSGKEGVSGVMIGFALLVLMIGLGSSVLLTSCDPPTPTPTNTPTPTLTNTPTPTPTSTPTDTTTPTPTDTPTPTPTNTPTPTPTSTPTNTPTPTPTSAPAPDPLLIDNCEDGDNQNLLGGYWFTYDDRERGGTSEVVPPARSKFNCTAGVAQMTGRVTTGYEFGFVGMGTDFAEPRDPRDVSGYRGVSFWVMGDGKEYRVSFPQKSIGDFGYRGRTFVAPQWWTQTTILFSDLSQEEWATPVAWSGTDVYGIQWQTVGQPHDSIFLAIDELRFVR